MITIPSGAVVVVDIDDTLYLERDYVRSGFEAVGQWLAAEHGRDHAATELWAGFLAGVRGDAFNRVLRAGGLDPGAELVAAAVETYRNHRPTIELAPDARRFLDGLGSRRSAVITDGPRSSQRAKAEALGLFDLVDLVVITDELGPGGAKPSPVAYRLVEERFGAAPTGCWYLADNPAKDFVSPLARGWSAVRVRRPDSLHHAVPTPAGVVEVSTLDHVSFDAETSP